MNPFVGARLAFLRDDQQSASLRALALHLANPANPVNLPEILGYRDDGYREIILAMITWYMDLGRNTPGFHRTVRDIEKIGKGKNAPGGRK